MPVGQPGQLIRIAETTSGQWFCLGGGIGDDMSIGLDSSPDSTPRLTDAGSWAGPGVWYLFVLPSDLPDGLELVDVDGGGLVFARTADGDHLLLIDYAAAAEADPSQFVPRIWQLLDMSGAVVLELRGDGPAAGSAAPTMEELFACLEQQGLDREAPQPYPAELASAAWQECRSLDLEMMAASGMPEDQVAQVAGFVDCMADRGYIQVWLQTDAIDIAAHNTASTACTAATT